MNRQYQTLGFGKLVRIDRPIDDTEDGTISGWNPKVDPTHAVIAVDNSSSGAFYTGLAIGADSSGRDFIYAADQANNKVDIYDFSFKFVKSFTDTSLPQGYAAPIQS